MARKLGTDEGLYIATTAPTTAADHGDAAYSLFGYVIGVDLNIEGESIIARDKDAGAFGYPLAGAKSGTMTVSFHRNFTGDTAQEAVEDAALATTLTGQTVYYNLTSTTASDKGRHGTAVVTSHTLSSNVDEFGEGSITMALQSTYTRHTEA